MLGVIGLGRLGLPLACVLVEWGHRVIGIDQNAERVDMLRAGHSPIQEPEVPVMIDYYMGQLLFDTDPARLRGADIVFVVTPTPSGPDGAFSLEYVEEAVSATAPHLGRKALLVVVSTVMPGHMRRLADLVDCGLCYNPQFIALGSVIRDLRRPDFILIGADRENDAERLVTFYEKVIAGVPIQTMDFASAEIAKLALNCYVTMKISYANMLGEVCCALGADAGKVTDAIGLDRRIGGAYLSPGTAYGGPCFPRDNAAFIRAAAGVGVTAPLPEATQAVNEAQTARLVRQVLQKKGAWKVGVLGLAYKVGTPVYEQSAGMALVKALQDAGVAVRAHDPQAQPSGVPLDTLDNILDWADTLVIATPWSEYRNVGRGQFVIDPWRLTYDV